MSGFHFLQDLFFANTTYVIAFGLFGIGVIGILTRRSILHVLSSSLICSLCPFLILAAQGERTLDIATPLAIAFGLLFVTSTGTIIAVYRRRGTINIDELRELRG